MSKKEENKPKLKFPCEMCTWCVGVINPKRENLEDYVCANDFSPKHKLGTSVKGDTEGCEYFEALEEGAEHETIKNPSTKDPLKDDNPCHGCMGASNGDCADCVHQLYKEPEHSEHVEKLFPESFEMAFPDLVGTCGKCHRSAFIGGRWVCTKDMQNLADLIKAFNILFFIDCHSRELDNLGANIPDPKLKTTEEQKKEMFDEQKSAFLGRCNGKSQMVLEEVIKKSQEAKADLGKPKITKCPTDIIRAISYIREYGDAKYSPDSWKQVEPQRYRDAMMRHALAYVDDPYGVDEESGFPHLWHLACNVAFLCYFDKDQFELGDENGRFNE